MNDIPEAVLSFFRENGIFPANKPLCILAGFSGGADSTALLHMLSTLQKAQTGKKRFKLLAVHVHHGIRGAEADRDAAFCRAFCSSLGIPCSVMAVNVPELAENSKQSLESAAREARYDCFQKQLSIHPEITHLVTAHHADDQAETVLFRMLRGSAMCGLKGIPACRPMTVKSDHRTIILLRPLLHIPKEQLLAYCSKQSLKYVTDSSNTINDCSRNLLRNQILPQLKNINPAFTDALLRLSAMAEIDESYFQEEVMRITAKLPLLENIPLPYLAALPPALSGRVLLALFSRALESLRGVRLCEHPLSNKHISAMQLLLTQKKKPAELFLPGDICFSVFPAGGICRFSLIERSSAAPTRKTDDSLKKIPLLPGKTVLYGGAACCLDDDSTESIKKIKDLKNIYKFFISASINSDTISNSMYIRARLDNKQDHYRCGGSEKTVKDALSAHKVPPHMRKNIPLYCDGAGIVWIPFCGIRDSVNMRYTAQQISSTEQTHKMTLYYFYQS